MSNVQQAREKYRPVDVKLLFIAEAPPCSPDRFFYFEEVNSGDSLFLHIIREVFPDVANWEVKEIRKRKEELLLRFMEDGYFLEDSVAVAIPKGTTIGGKMKLIRENQHDLKKRISAYQNVPIILLSSTVFKSNSEFLKADFNILNDLPIPFPGSGQQGNFKREIRKYLL